MKHENERVEGVPCNQRDCHYWDKSMSQNCDKENGSGDPGPAFCIDYIPQPQDSADARCSVCGVPKGAIPAFLQIRSPNAVHPDQ